MCHVISCCISCFYILFNLVFFNALNVFGKINYCVVPRAKHVCLPLLDMTWGVLYLDGCGRLLLPCNNSFIIARSCCAGRTTLRTSSCHHIIYDRIKRLNILIWAIVIAFHVSVAVGALSLSAASCDVLVRTSSCCCCLTLKRLWWSSNVLYLCTWLWLINMIHDTTNFWGI